MNGSPDATHVRQPVFLNNHRSTTQGQRGGMARFPIGFVYGRTNEVDDLLSGPKPPFAVSR
jgi:hypothetical protein